MPLVITAFQRGARSIRSPVRQDNQQPLLAQLTRYLVRSRSICIPSRNTPSPGAHLAPRRAILVAALFDTTRPDDVVQECLSLCRKIDVASLKSYLHPAPSSPPPLPEFIESSVQERDPLACCAAIFDVGARRVLPGHLLRRSRVLATLYLDEYTYMQRIALSGRTGEEAVFDWTLRKCLSTSNTRGDWLVYRVERDDSTDVPLPSTPHPKNSPEAVIKAQLAALGAGELYEAATFNSWERISTDTRLSVSQAGEAFSLGIQYGLLLDRLSRPAHAALLNHQYSILGAAALLTPTSEIQEVLVSAGPCSSLDPFGGGKQTRFLWHMTLAPNGCWMCRDINANLD